VQTLRQATPPSPTHAPRADCQRCSQALRHDARHCRCQSEAQHRLQRERRRQLPDWHRGCR
jgi:hypothetical protein